MQSFKTVLEVVSSRNVVGYLNQTQTEFSNMINSLTPCICGSSIAAFLVFFTNSAFASEFVPLGGFPGGVFSSRALGVDDSGSVVVGSSSGSMSESFVWTQTNGMMSINATGYAAAVSGDGQTVVGGVVLPSIGFTEPFFWTDSGGVQLLGFPLGETQSVFTAALDVSHDGSLIVGFTTYGGVFEAFTWTMVDGFIGLGDLFNGAGDSTATAVSSDGSVVVGQSTGNGEAKAFRWTTIEGMTDLGDLRGGGSSSAATNVSPDGSVIVGQSDSARGIEAFRWTQTSGLDGLGFLPGFEFQSIATATTKNGRAVVGLSGLGGTLGSKAFVWTEQGGMQSLQHVLENQFGLASALENWSLTDATDISADGRSIVGRGMNPDGNTEAWLVRLEQPVFIPEPWSFYAITLAGISILLSRRHWVDLERRNRLMVY